MTVNDYCYTKLTLLYTTLFNKPTYVRLFRTNTVLHCTTLHYTALHCTDAASSLPSLCTKDGVIHSGTIEPIHTRQPSAQCSSQHIYPRVLMSESYQETTPCSHTCEEWHCGDRRSDADVLRQCVLKHEVSNGSPCGVQDCHHSQPSE